MELDELKYVWRSAAVPAVRDQQQSAIAEILQRGGRHAVGTMKRNLGRETLLLLLYAPLIIWYFAGFHGKLRELGWFVFFVLIFFAVYYYIKNRLLSAMLLPEAQVKTSLERQVRGLERLLRFYLVSGTLLAPLSLIFLFFLLYQRLPPPLHPNLFYPSRGTPGWQLPLSLGIITAGCTVALYFANRWYIKTLYGRHLTRLKALLEEITAQ